MAGIPPTNIYNRRWQRGTRTTAAASKKPQLTYTLLLTKHTQNTTSRTLKCG